MTASATMPLRLVPRQSRSTTATVMTTIDDDNSEGEDARQSRALRRATRLAERKPRLHPIVGDEEGASSRRGASTSASPTPGP